MDAQTPPSADYPDFYTVLLAAGQKIGQVLHITMTLPDDIERTDHPVIALARASRVRVRQVALQGNWWTEDSGPMLVLLQETGQPAAVIPAGAGKYHLYDPVQETTRPVTADIAARLDSAAFIFFRAFPERPIGITMLLRFSLQSIRGDIARLFMVGIAGEIMGLIVPVATGVIFDTVIPSGDGRQLMIIGIMLFLSALAIALFQIARSVFVLRIQGKVDYALQAAIWDRLLRLPASFFRKYSAGDLTERALGVTHIKWILSDSITLSLFSGIFSGFNFLLLLYYDAWLAVIALGLILFSIFMTGSLGRIHLYYANQSTRLQGEISGLLLQLLNGIAKLRVAHAEAGAFTLWGNRFIQQRTMMYGARTVQNVQIVFITAYPVLASMVVFAMVYYQTGMSTGQFLAFNVAFSQLMYMGLELSRAFVTALSAVPYYKRLKPVLRTLPESTADKKHPGHLSGDIRMENVAFRYHKDSHPVLKNITFDIKSGEFVALVSSYGAGKSTILRLLLGFETPEQGAIYYDGQPLCDLNIQAVRRQIGIVLQDGHLLTGDILTNIIGMSNLSIEEAWQAARLAGIEADIHNMPMGMYTYVNEEGTTLSGGQRQQIQIARALVKHPRIIFFDEATSALDDKSQKHITLFMEAFYATRIVIAHRLSTIRRADRILVLKDGWIIESGTFYELMAKDGYFTELARQQLEQDIQDIEGFQEFQRKRAEERQSKKPPPRRGIATRLHKPQDILDSKDEDSPDTQDIQDIKE